MIKLAVSATIISFAMIGAALGAAEGTAVGVKPDAASRTGNVERVLVVGADVSVGETVVTGPSGNVQLLFDDQTRLVVGPRSALRIETYLLNGNRADKFGVNALAGTFRFISGNSPKSAYSINTPTASIAVRGTEFDLTVGGGRSFVMLFEGALRICEDSICVDLVSRCDIGIAGGGIADLLKWGNVRRDEVVANFPLPNIQAGFLPPFRVGGAQACLAPPSGGTGGSLSDGPSGPVPQSQNQNQNRACTDPKIC